MGGLNNASQNRNDDNDENLEWVVHTPDLGRSTDSKRVCGRQSQQLGIVEVDNFTVRLHHLNLSTSHTSRSSNLAPAAAVAWLAAEVVVVRGNIVRG